jgi:hypothetical protein
MEIGDRGGCSGGSRCLSGRLVRSEVDVYKGKWGGGGNRLGRSCELIARESRACVQSPFTLPRRSSEVPVACVPHVQVAFGGSGWGGVTGETLPLPGPCARRVSAQREPASLGFPEPSLGVNDWGNVLLRHVPQPRFGGLPFYVAGMVRVRVSKGW